MAKKPTKTPTAAPTTAASAPAQPWGNSAPATETAQTDIAPTPATSEDAKPEGEVTSEQKDAVTPSGENPSEQVSEQLGDGAEGNGGGVDSAADETDADEDADELDADEAEENAPEAETTSIERDKVTPTGKRPEEIHDEAARVSRSLVNEKGERLEGIAPPGEVIAEARDQVTPHGRDLSLKFDDQRKVSLHNSALPTDNEKLAARMSALSEDDQAELMAEIGELAEEALTRREKAIKANEMRVNMVSGDKVYGNRARRENHDETLGGLSNANSNVQLNRRARRAAERLQRAEQAAKKSK